jgi:HD-GYP domain-containing protein (c-di-GMP phosphodiesterase class II)/HAMP domain-containing protein
MTGMFNRLQWRVFIFLAVSLMTLLGLFSFTYNRIFTRQVIREAATHSALVVDTIHLGLAQSMMTKNREGIQLSLRDIANNPEILEVFVTDRDGKIVFSSEPALGGKNIGHTAFAGMEESPGWKRAGDEAPGRLYRYMAIPNREPCQECHAPTQAFLGGIAIGISLEGPERLIQTNRYLFLAMVSLVLFLLFVVNAHFFSRNVTRPVEKLLERFRQIGEGNLHSSPMVEPAHDDELGVLAVKFEELVATITDLHQREKEKEKEVALLQRERDHQEELEQVNQQLSERLEKLDMANRRINTLAGQLEEKNESLQNAVKNISALNRVGVALSSELDLEKVSRLLINISAKGLRAEIGYIMLMDEKHEKLEMRSWTGMSEEFDETRTVSAGESVSGMVAKTGQPVLIPLVDGDAGIKSQSRYGFTRLSVISAPIKIKEKVLGVIELNNKRGTGSFNEEDLQMLQSIANQAAVAIENANLYQEVQQSYFDTIKALVQAVEEKDNYTRGHSERVTTFSSKIAERMGFSARQMQAISYGGVLHDIGKIGIDVNIIQKPGRLTQEEYNLIKDHPLIGERIISPIAFLKEVLPIVSQHHERYDGKGYPMGIDGSVMAPEARVLSVADAYDAMITARPYRNPLPREEAIAELRRCSGTQFDPIVVEHFLEILEEDPDIHKLEESLSKVGM